MKDLIHKRFKESFDYGKGTLAIILINIIVFIALNKVPSLREMLLLNSDIDVILKKPWTLITVFFSHEVYYHIALNMGLLFLFGVKLEKLTNPKTLIAIYITAGLAGSIAFPVTRMFISRLGLIAGASAATMGVVGALSVLQPNEVILASKAKFWGVALIFFSLVSAILNVQTLDSDLAHILGVLTGLAIGYILKKYREIW